MWAAAKIGCESACLLWLLDGVAEALKLWCDLLFQFPLFQRVTASFHREIRRL